LGNEELNKAANILSSEQIALRIKLALVEALPGIIHESVKPIEQIDGIKIFQVEGLGAAGNGGEAAHGSPGSGNLADQVVNSALRYRGQAPLLDALMSEIGLNGGDINALASSLKLDSNGKAGTAAAPPSASPEKPLDLSLGCRQALLLAHLGDNVQSDSSKNWKTVLLCFQL